MLQSNNLIGFGAYSSSASTPVTSYANTGGTGDRTAIITASMTGASVFGGTASNLVDGAFGNNTTDSIDYNSCNWVDGDYFAFDFGSAQYIDEIRWQFDRSAGWGTWVIQGSTDNSSWTSYDSFTFSGNTTDTTQSVTGVPSSGYRYWRLRKSGSTTGGVPRFREVEFKIAPGA